MNDAFMRGANLFLQGQGIKDARERQIWLQRFQESQMKTQELQQQMLIQKIADQQTQQRSGQEPSGLSLLERAKMQMEAPEQYGQMGMSEFGQIPTKTVEAITATPLSWEQLKRYPTGMAEEMYRRGTIGVPGMPPPPREPKFKPEPYVDAQGNVFSLEPGQPVPPGARPYEKPQKPLDISGSDYKTIQDKRSPTGWSYQHITDPTKTIKGAPPPRSERPTEAERDPNAHKFSQSLLDAKRTEPSALFMEKLSEVEQQRAESRLRMKTKSNYMARGGNPAKFDQFWKENVYGAMDLDPEDIVTLKEYGTPDEAISHVERAYRANMISPEIRDKAMTLINTNRKKWNEWRTIR